VGFLLSSNPSLGQNRNHKKISN